MNTEAKTLHIRRAEPTDAVNIYRLVVGEEKRAGTAVVLNDAARLTDIIMTIATGYVSVATISGRIVGSIGAVVSDSSGTKVLVGAWFALSPSFLDTSVAASLAIGLAKAANDAGLPVKFMLHRDAPLSDALVEIGFEPKLTVWGYEPSNQEEPAEAVEAPAE